MDTINILFCGTGGQGILTAAEIVGLAAMYDGHHVKKSEVHGMAQRGGSVESHLRFGKEVFSPIIEAGKVDFLLSFDKGEHDRMVSMLKQDGTDLFDDFVTSGVSPTRYAAAFSSASALSSACRARSSRSTPAAKPTPGTGRFCPGRKSSYRPPPAIAVCAPSAGWVSSKTVCT